MAADLTAAVERGDLSELVPLVDLLVAHREWEAVVELRDRCRAALERGKQLWPAASWAEYRLALDAPGPWAGPVLVDGAGRFAPGPLPEVAASTHHWAELAPHAPRGPVADMAAHERVVRGEDLTADDRVDGRGLGVPLRLWDWEPAWPVATYTADGVELPRPDRPAMEWRELGEPGEASEDPTATGALLDLTARWLEESDGRSEVVAVRGDASSAVAALGLRRVRLAEVEGGTALSHMAWAAASGGAHGRRRGAAYGRSAAWWAASAVAGLGEDAMDPQAVGEAVGELRWFAWDAGEPDTGWSLRLAVEDAEHGLAWAVAASDAEL